MRALRHFVILLVLAAGLCPTARLAAVEERSFKIITHPDVVLDSIDTENLRKLFLGLKAQVGDVTLVPALLNGGDVHRDFLKVIVAKSETGFRLYWRKQVFSGNGRQPVSFDTEVQLLAHVRRTPSAIAYVASRTATPGVKVLMVE